MTIIQARQNPAENDKQTNRENQKMVRRKAGKKSERENESTGKDKEKEIGGKIENETTREDKEKKSDEGACSEKDKKSDEKPRGGKENRKNGSEKKDVSLIQSFGKEAKPLTAIALVFLLVPIASILISPTFQEEDVKAFEEEDSYVNPFLYLLLILGFTLLILTVSKYFKKDLIQLIILGAFFVTMIYAFYPFLTFLTTTTISIFIAGIISALLTFSLFKYPEWYVVDAAGISVSVGVTSIIGISFGPGPFIVLMLILAVYDAISVYKTKHMIDLADSVMEFNLPVMLVIPRKLPFSFLKKEKGGLKEQIDSGEKRDALYIGLGDIIFPSALAVSLYVYLGDRVPYQEFFGVSGVIFVAAGVILGTIIGYFSLMGFVLKGNPQAGLPLLNGGAILGYLIPVLAIYQSLGLW